MGLNLGPCLTFTTEIAHHDIIFHICMSNGQHMNIDNQYVNIYTTYEY